MYLDMRDGAVEPAVTRLVAAIHRHQLERLGTLQPPSYDVGIVIPTDIANWEDAQIFEFIQKILEPEAWLRAQREYDSVTVRDPMTALREERDRKLEEVARRHGFLNAWTRYRSRRDRPPNDGSAPQ
jgi:hypothetical protein